MAALYYCTLGLALVTDLLGIWQTEILDTLYNRKSHVVDWAGSSSSSSSGFGDPQTHCWICTQVGRLAAWARVVVVDVPPTGGVHTAVYLLLYALCIHLGKNCGLNYYTRSQTHPDIRLDGLLMHDILATGGHTERHNDV